ncbi:MAG: WYL domain-containing transcriptional regulator [Oscillospiraceae bacterium]|nr:WYL domain-containing transcriptional regulator [Oscillospiraceae bacterium]
MESLEPKKLALIRIMQILQKHSDYDHPLTQEDIARYLENDYDIVIERKAVSRNISLLKEAGLEIESNRKGSYLNERDFTDAELRILIDGVLSSKHITAKYSKDLIDKLCSLSNKYFRSHVEHIHTVGDWDKTENKDLFYNIEIVDEAIEQKKQIRFDYNKYGVDKKLHKTTTHYASPYQLILHNQRYYLMAQNERWKNMAFYRLDHITNMSITEKKRTLITAVEGYEKGINYKDLSTALPYMFTDKPERVEFIAESQIIDQIIDWFGKDIRINPYGDDDKQVKVAVKVSPMAMEHWAMQYINYVKITSPQALVDKIKDNLRDASEKYYASN